MSVGLTTIEVGDIIERALARAGIQPQNQTPEAVFRARQNLMLQLARMASVGLYPWQVIRRIVGTVPGQAGYQLPIGTVDLLNVQRREPTLATGPDSLITTLQRRATLVTPGRVLMVGVTLVGATNGLDQTLTIETSIDGGVSWTSRAVVNEVMETLVRWVEIDGALVTTDVRATLTGSGNATMTLLQLASSYRDASLGEFNRDDWATQPNKSDLLENWTCYFFDKQARPILWLWQTPSSVRYLIWTELQHQGIDLPELYQTIDLPTLHLDAMIDQLAARLAKEIPNGNVAGTKPEADEGIMDGQAGASDDAPIRISPNIRRYTR